MRSAFESTGTSTSYSSAFKTVHSHRSWSVNSMPAPCHWAGATGNDSEAPVVTFCIVVRLRSRTAIAAIMMNWDPGLRGSGP